MENMETLNPRAGWFGRMDQVLHYLRTVNADRTDDGKFTLRASDGGVASFMGSTDERADVCVTADVEYFADGRACNLAAGMNSTSYGFGAVVIF